jgi:hypothetical protein
MKKITCMCCGYITITSEYDICPVCEWESSSYQEEHPDDDGGPNRVSLRKAQRNFQEFGASTQSAIHHVRKPMPEEIKDLSWEN